MTWWLWSSALSASLPASGGRGRRLAPTPARTAALSGIASPEPPAAAVRGRAGDAGGKDFGALPCRTGCAQCPLVASIREPPAEPAVARNMIKSLLRLL